MITTLKDKKDGQGAAFWQANEIGLNADRYETVVSHEYKGFKLALEFFDEVDHSFISQAVYSPKGEYIFTPFLDLRVFSEGHEDKGLINLRAFRQFVDACLSV